MARQVASVGVGIIGAGFGARVHLPGFASVPGIEVVGIADSGSGRAAAVAAKYARVKAFADWRRLLERPDIEAVAVATPPHTHFEIVTAAIAAGKHVLCEKPLGLSVPEAAALTQAICASGRIGAVDFEYRMDPGIDALEAWLRRPECGPLRRIDVTWLTSGRSDPLLPWSWQYDAERGGGVLNAFGSHVVDYAEWLAQSQIERIGLVSRIVVPRRSDGEGRFRRVTAEDYCDITGELGNGAVLTARISNCFPFDVGHRIELLCDNGYARYAVRAPYNAADVQVLFEDARGRWQVDPDVLTGGRPEMPAYAAPFRTLVQDFLTAIKGPSIPRRLPSFADGTRASKILAAARRAAERPSMVSI